MKLSIRRGQWGLAAVLVAACAVAGCSSSGGTTSSKTTITEEDYFNTPGQIAALAAYSKAFEAAHPGVTGHGSGPRFVSCHLEFDPSGRPG